MPRSATDAGAGAAPPVEVVARCDLCGSTDADPLFPVRDRVHGLPGAFAIVRCSACRLIRLSPRPVLDQLGFYYPDADYAPFRAAAPPSRQRVVLAVRDAVRRAALESLGYPTPTSTPTRTERLLTAAILRLPALRRLGAYRSEGFPPWVPGGRALEVGPGNGAFLYALRRHGWRVAGLDTSSAAAQAARRYYGIDVAVGELGRDPFAAGSFDFVHMRHVIEHVGSPSAAMRRVSELLAPGGRVYVETPNAAGTGLQRYGDRWFPVEAPRHLWLFDPSTLTRLLAESGLNVGSVRTTTYLTPQWAAAFRAQDRTGAAAAAQPVVAPRERPAVLAERLADLARLVRDRRSGDILGVWAVRPRG